MNVTENLLIKLIYQSQFDFPEVIDFSSINMDELYYEALNQSVLGIVSKQIPKCIVNESFKQAILQQKANIIRYCHSQNDLVNILNSASIPFVILKGGAAAIYYKDPTLRSMGDVDFLVPISLYSKAKDVLINAGFKEGHSNDKHISFYKNGLCFELHHHVSEGIDIDDIVSNGLTNIETANINGYAFPILPKLENGIVLLDHLRRHFQTAVGIRQVIDWMMFVHCNLDDEFWNDEFRNVVKDKGLETLAIVITRMCQIYMGLPESITWCKGANEQLCKRIMEITIASGNFGRKSGIGRSIEKVNISIKNTGLLSRLQNSGEYNWNAYHKHHWLKPFCWIYQCFRYAKQGINSGRSAKQLKGDLDRSKERLELLKELGID